MIQNFSKLNDLPNFSDNNEKKKASNFFSEEVLIKDLDYYFSNSISRASKTMSECRQIKINSKKTGTEN